MKKTVLVFLLCVVALTAYAQKSRKRKRGADAPLPAAPARPLLNTYMDSVSYAIGVNIGQTVVAQGMDSLNADLLTTGLRGMIAKKDTARTDSLLLTEIQAMSLLQGYFTKMRQQQEEKNKQMSQANKKAAEDYMAANKNKPGVTTTGTGLQYMVLKEGTGPYPKPTDRVKVHYTGTFTDGRKFDSSVDRGQPAVFGVTQVIKGWTEALQMMKVGSKWQLAIPPDLGYGAEGRGADMPPHSVLLFDVELLGIEK